MNLCDLYPEMVDVFKGMTPEDVRDFVASENTRLRAEYEQYSEECEEIIQGKGDLYYNGSHIVI